MTAIAFPFSLPLIGRSAPQTRAQVHVKPPQPYGSGPIFIHDAVMPYRGETLLSARLKADLAALEVDEPH